MYDGSVESSGNNFNLAGLTPKAKKAKTGETTTGSGKRGRKPKNALPSPVAMTNLATVPMHTNLQSRKVPMQEPEPEEEENDDNYFVEEDDEDNESQDP